MKEGDKVQSTGSATDKVKETSHAVEGTIQCSTEDWTDGL